MKTFFNLIMQNIDLLKYFIFFVVFSLLYGVTNRIWFNKKPIILETKLDRAIPLIPWTIYIYHLWAPLLLFCYLLFLAYDRSIFMHMGYLYVITQILCSLFYIFFQNEVPQNYKLEDNSFTSKLVKYTKSIDNPYNGFPSIHVFTCYVCIVGLFYLPISLFIKSLLILLSILVIISTVTTKQHVILDALGALIFLIAGQLIYFFIII